MTFMEKDTFRAKLFGKEGQMPTTRAVVFAVGDHVKE